MKNLIIITLITITSIGCSKSNDDPKNNIPDKLIGKWKITEEYYTDGSSTGSGWDNHDSGKNYDLWLKADGTYTDGTAIECNNCSYTVSDNKIYFLPNGNEFPAEIQFLSDTNLTIWWDDFEGAGIKYLKTTE